MESRYRLCKYVVQLIMGWKHKVGIWVNTMWEWKNLQLAAVPPQKSPHEQLEYNHCDELWLMSVNLILIGTKMTESRHLCVQSLWRLPLCWNSVRTTLLVLKLHPKFCFKHTVWMSVKTGSNTVFYNPPCLLIISANLLYSPQQN